MKAFRTVSPVLEALEDRLTPATTPVFNNITGALSVTSNDLSLELRLVADDEIQVWANGVLQGDFANVTSMTVTEQNSLGSPQVVFDASAPGFEFDGNVIINAGNAVGGNLISLGDPTPPVNPFGPAPMTIAGNVTVTSGNGPDSFFFGQGSDVTLLGSLRVDLGSVAGPLANDTMSLGQNGGSSVTGNVTLFNGTSISLTNLPIGGSLSTNAAAQLENQSVSLSSVTVTQNLSITTGTYSDSVTIDPFTTVNGSAVINLGNGSLNSLGGAPGDSLIQSGAILGSLAVSTGQGPSTTSPGAESLSLSGTVGNTLSITLGSGKSFTTLSGLTVLGNAIRYSTGSGANTLNVNSLIAPGARLTALFGAGNDTLIIDTTGIILGSAYFDGGYGVNHVIHTGVYFYPVTLLHFS